MKPATRKAVDRFLASAHAATVCGCGENKLCNDDSCEALDAIDAARWKLCLAIADDDEFDDRIYENIEPGDFAEDWLNEELRKLGVDPAALEQRVDAFMASLMVGTDKTEAGK